MNFMVVLDVSRVKSSQRTHDWAVGADSFKLVSGAKDDGIASLLTSNQLFNPLWDGSSSKTCTLFFILFCLNTCQSSKTTRFRLESEWSLLLVQQCEVNES